jgi:polyhydroxyalkanoate synthesis repressor PhaR
MPEGDPSPQSEPQRLEIRRYANRRFYDTTQSRPVTQQEIHQFVREGHEVRVTDAKTGADITVRVLAQIILDMDEPKLAVFPVELLHRLIQSNETIVRDFVDKYFNQALMVFLQSRRKFEEQLRAMTGLRSGTALAQEWTRFVGAPFFPQFWMGGAPSAPEPTAATPAANPAPVAPSQKLEQTIEELREQVQLLQQRLTEIDTAAPAAPKAAEPPPPRNRRRPKPPE